MKKKIIGISVDILLIMVVVALTNFVSLKLFNSENFWHEFGIYIVFYAIVFGIKRIIVILWNRLASKQKENN